MNVTDAAGAARDAVDHFGFADYDEDFDYYQALVGDGDFAATAYLWVEAGVYADASRHNADAQARLERALREHAQRVLGEVTAA